MAKKLSDVFNSIKYAKLDPKHNKPHKGGSTDDEEHGAVSEIEFDQQVAHAKKRSMTESESVKRTQTNLKNIETSKSGYSVDDEEYRKHIERMKKSRDEYIKNNPNSIYAVKKEEVKNIEEKSDQAQQNKTRKNTMDASRGASWKIRNNMTGDSVRDWDNKHPNAQAQNKAIGRALRGEELEYTQEQIEEAIDHIITARQIIGHAKKNAGSSHEYMKFLKSLRDKFGKEYSTNVHKTASKLATEEVEPIGEAKSNYQVYHSSYSSAVQHARKKIEDKGYTIHDDDWFHHVNSGPRKPSEGKTNSLHIPLHKDGKPIKKQAHIQVYNRGNDVGNNYELNMYHESVEIVEAKKMKGEDPCWKNYQMVGTKKKNGKEVPNCVPVNESRQADIVRETYLKAKNKKKNGKDDNDVSGKVQKFEADPEMTDTIEKQ